jgi:hypothetical protein
LSTEEVAKPDSRDVVSKLIATIIIGNIATVVLVGMSIAANALINSEELLFVVVGFMTYAATAIVGVASVYGLLKIWSPKL